jgi:hypothetical protein
LVSHSPVETTDIYGRRFAGAQQTLAPFCIGGQTTEPKEQKTQQSPASGRTMAWQAAHSWKNTHASVGIDNVSV